jgi:hypothetical protein
MSGVNGRAMEIERAWDVGTSTRSGTRPDRTQVAEALPGLSGRVLGLQARAGNRAVSAMLRQPAVQRQGDPGAVADAVARIEAVLDPAQFDEAEAPSGAVVQASRDVAVQREEKEPEPTRNANAGDAVKAVLATEPGKQAVAALKEEAKHAVQTTSTGDKVVIVTTGLAMGGLAVGGVFSDPSARKLLVPMLNDKQVPVPGVPGLSASLKVDDNGMPNGGMLYFDVGQFIPGFQ